MKEFALKHPFITFLLADAVFYNVLTIVNNIVKACASNKEEKYVESSGDNQ